MRFHDNGLLFLTSLVIQIYDVPGTRFSLRTLNSFSGADPGFFLGGGAPLRNDITDGEVKKKIKYVYTKKKASSQGGVRTPCTLPLDPPLVFEDICRSKFTRNVKYCSNVAQSAKKCLNTERSYKRQGHAPLRHFVGSLCNGGKPE